MLNIAVSGATGLVGQTIIEILEQRNFPVKQLFPLASEKSAGDSLLFKDRPVIINNLAEFDFQQNNVDLAFFSSGREISAKYVEPAAKTGCVVIDNTSHFRYQDNIPLVVPEINPDDLKLLKDNNIISNPNCATIQALLVLKPIHDLVGIERIDFMTYQSVSGSGKAAISELVTQTTEALNGKPIEPKFYAKQIAFNIIPHVDIFQDNGYSKEEMKMVWETHKVLHDDSIKITATTVRVPTLYGHSVSMHIVTKKPIAAATAKEILAKAPGVKVLDDPKNNIYPTNIPDAVGSDEAIVGRIRNFLHDENGLAMWVIADNVRKGGALNAVQIAEMLLTRHMLK
jgi:aspartate-semialdehyde dehydrogenase